MPYKVRKQGSKYVVYKKDTGERVGTTAGDKESLRKYLAALHINASEGVIKLADLMGEDFGGPGKAVYASDHKAGMKVAKGGSMCANCEHWIEEGNKCNNKYWIKWAQTDTIPEVADEYCCDWWGPSKA